MSEPRIDWCHHTDGPVARVALEPTKNPTAPQVDMCWPDPAVADLVDRLL